MASRSTKATPPKSIATLYRGWVRAVTTGDRSAASKSSLRSSRIEAHAAAVLEKRGWRIVHRNVHVAHVQIDILARDPRGLLTVVEVKSHSPLVNLSWRQRRRLFRAGRVLAGFEPVQLVLAQVSGRDVLVLPVDALTD